MAVRGYAGRQVALHWVIAVLMGIQYAFHWGIKGVWFAQLRGEATGFSLSALIHVLLGITVLLLALPRIWLRLTRGVPDLPEHQTPLLALLARVTHLMLYAIIVLMPVSGMLAWFGHLGVAATLHAIGSKLMLVFVALHVAGALYQHFVMRSDVLLRMLRAAD